MKNAQKCFWNMKINHFIFQKESKYVIKKSSISSICPLVNKELSQMNVWFELHVPIINVTLPYVQHKSFKCDSSLLPSLFCQYFSCYIYVCKNTLGTSQRCIKALTRCIITSMSYSHLHKSHQAFSRDLWVTTQPM